MTLLTPWFWTYGLRNCETINLLFKSSGLWHFLMAAPVNQYKREACVHPFLLETTVNSPLSWVYSFGQLFLILPMIVQVSPIRDFFFFNLKRPPHPLSQCPVLNLHWFVTAWYDFVYFSGFFFFKLLSISHTRTEAPGDQCFCLFHLVLNTT